MPLVRVSGLSNHTALKRPAWTLSQSLHIDLKSGAICLQRVRQCQQYLRATWNRRPASNGLDYTQSRPRTRNNWYHIFVDFRLSTLNSIPKQILEQTCLRPYPSSSCAAVLHVDVDQLILVSMASADAGTERTFNLTVSSPLGSLDD